MITVLVPHRAGQTVEWQAHRTEETTSTVAEVIVAGRRHVIRFPRPGVDAAVEIKLAE
jgi:hypothetical protein